MQHEDLPSPFDQLIDDCAEQMPVGRREIDALIENIDKILRENARLRSELEAMKQEIFELKNEVNCRREHGADGFVHLEYIEHALGKIIQKIGG